MHSMSSSSQQQCCFDGNLEDDVASINCEQHVRQNQEEPLNMEYAKFYDLLNSDQNNRSCLVWSHC